MLFNATQQYFSYIMAVSFIGGGNRSTQRKPLTCRKLLTNCIDTPRHERDSNLINAKIWTTYLLFVEQCMHLVYQEIHLKPFLYM